MLCCTAGTVLRPTGNVTLHVYGQDDIVSSDLKKKNSWETAEVAEWLWALQQWQRPTAPADSNASVPDRPLAVDIGANLGWFSLQAAAAGARVAAFEGGYCIHTLTLTFVAKVCTRRALAAGSALWYWARVTLPVISVPTAAARCHDRLPRGVRLASRA